MRKILLYIAFLSSVQVVAQTTEVKPFPLQGFNISGNYRFYAQHRYFTDPYAFQVVDGDPVYLQERSILIGDATQLPELTLNISGNPTPRTSFGTDLVVWNQNTGGFDYYRNLQLGVNLYGSFSTPLANFSIKAGGIHWHSMTAFTMMSFAGYNRYSIFERNPWDPIYRDVDRRYKDYYTKGAISQDTRWAQQAVQGVLLDITELPLGLAVNLVYGKTQNAGSAFIQQTSDPLADSTSGSFIQFFDNTIPNNAYAGRLIKTIGSHRVSFNTFNRISYSDAKATERIENHVYTLEGVFEGQKISVQGEFGFARYSDVIQDPGYGELATVKVKLHKKLIGLPLEIHAFRISPNAVNNNGEFVNTAITELPSAAAGSTTIIGANGVLTQTGSAMLGIGQMANNRQGLNLNTDIQIQKLKVILGWGVAKEIERLGNKITYGHTINGLTMSRFWRWSFPSNVGPYSRTSVLYRGVFETVELTDLGDNGDVVHDKYFNNIEAQVKYSFNLFGKPWYLFYLGAYNSAQPKFSAITVFNEDAYIRLYSHQVENYYHVHPKWVIAQYFGYERVVANYSTLVDLQSKRPRNQEGVAVGLGLDYQMAKNTFLFVRHRYFRFEDRSYELDRFAGHETTVEIKINF
ncbi:MAG: hypothetical protein KDC12_00815 [Flavobacteriales bacterium]|nr:hypothetical protein [Flavobacteriales bacterium]